MSERMQIGELARRSGASARTLRYYEQLGLIAPSERAGAGYRYYDAQALARLEKIAALKKLGLELEEIAGVIDLYFADAAAIVRGKLKVLDILRRHLDEADARIKSLRRTRKEIAENIARIEAFVAKARR